MYADCLRKLSSNVVLLGFWGNDGNYQGRVRWWQPPPFLMSCRIQRPTSPTNYSIFMHLVLSPSPRCHLVVHQSHVSIRDSIFHPIRHDNLSSTFRRLMIKNSYARIWATPLISGQLVHGASENGQPGVTASTCKNDSVGKHTGVQKHANRPIISLDCVRQSNQAFCNTELRELGELRFCFQSPFSTSSMCRRQRCENDLWAYEL